MMSAKQPQTRKVPDRKDARQTIPGHAIGESAAQQQRMREKDAAVVAADEAVQKENEIESDQAANKAV